MFPMQSASRLADSYVTLKGGLQCRIRPLRNDDRPLLADCFGRLSAGSRRLRFFAAKQVLSDRELDFYSDADQCNHIALVALALDGRGAENHVVGAVRCFRLAPDGDTAELAIAVADNIQGAGLGSALMDRLGKAARERGIHCFRFEVMAVNRGMRALAARCGATARGICDGVVDYELLLPEDASLAPALPWLLDADSTIKASEEAWLTSAEQVTRFVSFAFDALCRNWVFYQRSTSPFRL